MSDPWFTKPWRRTAMGRRAVVSACGYLAAGIGGVVLAIAAESTVRRVVWALFGAVFMSLGSTLVATLAYQRAASRHD